MLQYLLDKENERNNSDGITAKGSDQARDTFYKNRKGKRIGNLLSIVLLVVTVFTIFDYPEVAKTLLFFNIVLMLMQYLKEPVNDDWFFSNPNEYYQACKQFKINQFTSIFYRRDEQLVIISIIVPIVVILFGVLFKDYPISYWYNPSIGYIGILFALVPILLIQNIELIKKLITSRKNTKTEKVKSKIKVSNVVEFKKI